MNIRDWESRRTHQAWGTGFGNPALMILACLVVNFIALILAVVFNLVVNHDGHNDIRYGTGWVVGTAAPIASIIWTFTDVALCHYLVLHPIYYLVESTLLALLNLSMGLAGVIIYSWDGDGSFVPSIFILLAAVVYIYIMIVCARVIHKQRTRR